MNELPTITLNIHPIGLRLRKRVVDPTPDQYREVLRRDLMDRLFVYGVKKAGTLIVDQLANFVLDRRNNGADHFRFMDEQYPWLIHDVLEMLKAHCGRLVSKLPGGNPAPWSGYSLKTIHQMLAPWSEYLRESDALIVDGMANIDNYERVRKATGGLIKLGTSVWPGWLDENYAHDHPAPIKLTTLHNLTGVHRRRGLETWWGSASKRVPDGVEHIVWLTGHGGGSRAVLPFVQKVAAPTLSAHGNTISDHRLVAESFAARGGGGDAK